SSQATSTSTPRAPNSTGGRGLYASAIGSSPTRAATDTTDAYCDGYVGPGTLLAAQTSTTFLKYASSASSCSGPNHMSAFVLRLMLSTRMPWSIAHRIPAWNATPLPFNVS